MHVYIKLENTKLFHDVTANENHKFSSFIYLRAADFTARNTSW